MEILYEDKDLIVCIKERGVLSQEGKEGERTMLSLLSAYTGGEIYPVHRLDKEVGGVMVFARNQKTAAFLSSQVTDRTMEKEYITVVEGSPDEKDGTMEDLLFFDRSKNKSFTVKFNRAILWKNGNYKVVGDGICTDTDSESYIYPASSISKRDYPSYFKFISCVPLVVIKK